MRQRERHVQKKRLLLHLGFVQETIRLTRDYIVSVDVLVPAIVIAKRPHVVIQVKKTRVLIVRVYLVQIAEVGIEPLLPRHAIGADIAQPPLAECARHITGLLQHFRNRDVFGE